MTDPLRTEDFPAFDTYPGPESPRTAETGGRAIRAARELPERVDQARVSLRDRLGVIRGGLGIAGVFLRLWRNHA